MAIFSHFSQVARPSRHLPKDYGNKYAALHRGAALIQGILEKDKQDESKRLANEEKLLRMCRRH